MLILVVSDPKDAAKVGLDFPTAKKHVSPDSRVELSSGAIWLIMRA